MNKQANYKGIAAIYFAAARKSFKRGRVSSQTLHVIIGIYPRDI